MGNGGDEGGTIRQRDTFTVLRRLGYESGRKRKSTE